MVVGGIHTPKTGKYVRIRMRNPGMFKRKSFRTHDIGRKGYTKRIGGRLKKTGKWATQAYLIPKKEYRKKTPLVRRTLSQIRAQLRRRGIEPKF